MRRNSADDLWSRLESDLNGGCRLWTGPLVRNGYGRVKFGGRQVLVHRLAWELHHGEIPSALQVLHRCDVRCCANPDHLFLGSALDNMRDKMAKGRHRSSRHRAKVRPDEVCAIRQAIRSGETQAGVGKRYGLTQQSVSKIVNGVTWA